MARWQFVLGTLNGPETDLTYALGRSVHLRLYEPSTAEFTIDGRAEQALSIRELVSTLTVYRDGEAVFRGLIGATSDVIDQNQHTMTVTAIDFRARLERLIVDTEATYTDEPVKDIAWNLIDTAQQKPGADLQITEGSAVGGTTTSTITFEAGMSVLEAINTLQETDPGFDWDITPDAKFQLWDVRGTAAGVIIDYGGLATGVEVQFEPSTYANALRVSAGTALNPVFLAGTEFGPEGRYESQIGLTQIREQEILDEIAESLFEQSSEIKSSISLTLTDGEGAPRWGGPSNIFLGDICRMVINSGRLDFNDFVRVQEVSCIVGDSGEETVTLVLDAPAVRFSERIRNQERRLARLERQP